MFLTTKIKTLFVLFLFALIIVPSYFLFAADHSAPSDKKGISLAEFKDALPDSEKELSLEDFLKLKKEGKPLLVLDIRSKESFQKRHLKDSINLPLTDLTEKTLPQMAPDKNTPVVLLCDYSFAPVRMIAMTLQGYPVLQASGYKTIYRLNLWQGKKNIISDEEQEKLLAFEKS